jgi:hypothetical protein
MSPRPAVLIAPISHPSRATHLLPLSYELTIIPPSYVSLYVVKR